MVVIPGARTGSKLFELTLSPGSLVISRSDTAARQDVSELELRDFLKKRVDDGSLPMGGGGALLSFPQGCRAPNGQSLQRPAQHELSLRCLEKPSILRKFHPELLPRLHLPLQPGLADTGFRRLWAHIEGLFLAWEVGVSMFGIWNSITRDFGLADEGVRSSLGCMFGSCKLSE